MADKVSTILDVKLDAGKVAEDLQDLVTRIAALKAQQKDLNQQIKEGNDIDGKYAEQLIRVKDQLAWTEKQAKGLSATTKLLNADTQTYSDSLNGERQKLADMQKAYDQLDKAQRESEGGKAFLEAIKAQSDAVKGLEEDTGRAQRNVGNYPKAWATGIPIFDKTQKVLSGMGMTMQDLQDKGGKAFAGLGQSVKAFGKAFITPPIIIITAVLSAILLVVNKVREAFKKNDDAMTALNKAFAVFKPIGEAVAKAFDWVATALSKVVTAIADAVSWLVGKLSPAYKEAAEAAQEFVQAQDDLEEKERQYTINSSRRNRDIAELRAKTAEKEKYTAEERKKMLEQAIELEKQNLQEQKAIAAEKLRLLQIEAKQNADTSDEMKNKIAAARAAMYQAEEQYYSGVRSLNKQLTTFEKEEQEQRRQNAEKARKKREDAEKRAEQERIEREKNRQNIAQMSEDFALSLIQDETERMLAEYEIRGQREIDLLKERLKTEKNLTEESRNQLSQLIKDKQQKLYDDLNLMADKATEQRNLEEFLKVQQQAQRILEYKLQLTQEGGLEELELQKELLDVQMAQDLANTELDEEEKEEIRKVYQQRAKDLQKEYDDALKKSADDAKKYMKESFMSTAAAASKAFSAISDLLSEFSEDSEEAAAAQKAFGLTSILIDEAMSIASGAQAIAAAMAGAAEAAASTGPAAPFTLIAFQAQMVGQVLALIGSVASTIVQAKQIFSKSDAGNFAHGGTITGNSYTGDRLIAHVNSGEGIYTGTQANNILQEIANNPARGGFDYGRFADMLVEAVSALPAPVMVYEELKDFEQQVETYEEIASV